MQSSASTLEQVIYEGRSLGQSLDSLDSKLRPAVQSITFAALRSWAHAQERIQKLVPKKPSKEVDLLLCVACTLILDQERGDTQNSYPVHTIVNEAVKAAGSSPKTKFAQGLVNAVLRKIANPNNDEGKTKEGFGVAFPKWWLSQLQAAYPKQWQDICDEQSRRPPLILRINTNIINRADYCALLDSKHIAHAIIHSVGGIVLDTAIVIEDPIPVSQIPGFDEGLVSVQDAGAQLAAKLLSPQSGEHILDACAAPGGKTAHLAEIMGSRPYQLLALEINSERLKKVEGAIERLGLPKHTIHLVQGSASRQDWWDGQAFDKILCDVPCSASGIVRRHPDIVFLRRKEDIAAVIKVQRAILENAWRMLKPGGSLLYVSCSVFPQEGEEQMAWFVSQHPNALRLSAPGQLLPNLSHDGFFYGLLSKDQEQSN